MTTANDNDSNGVCKAHSGFKAKIDALERCDVEQWKEINHMKARSMVMLTSVVLTLLASLLSLAILLARAAG